MLWDDTVEAPDLLDGGFAMMSDLGQILAAPMTGGKSPKRERVSINERRDPRSGFETPAREMLPRIRAAPNARLARTRSTPQC